MYAKFWLEPVRLSRQQGFAALELDRLKQLVTRHRADLVEAWNDVFEL